MGVTGVVFGRQVLREEAIVPRSDNGKDINGHLFVLQQTR
jgi:hypothetical protein